MPKYSTANVEELTRDIQRWLDQFPGDIVCARQIWYEGLNAYGVPNPYDMEALHKVLNGMKDWTFIGDVRHEKFGVQPSYKKK